MRIFLLVLFFLMTVFGCSSQEVAAPKKKAEPELPKPRTRELGSLWSDDSRWNDVYADAPSRLVGDVVTVKLTEPMKARILQKAEAPMLAAQKEKEKKEADPKAPATQAAAAPAPVAPGKVAQIDAPPLMRATIQEILPRGIYVISGMETVKVKDMEPTIKLTGRVRDRDLDAEDAVSSDAIQNLDLQVKPTVGP